jgi:hypothetical protein
MEQHPIPRQITTFEFKLIGFMTLKQFLYLLVFFPLGFVIWKIIPIPYVNIALGAIVGLLGAALAFVPINDRPLDVWIKNLINRLTSPTQYVFHKHNQALYFLQDLYFVSDPHKVMAHVESKQKLASYLASRNQPADSSPALQASVATPAVVQQPAQPVDPVTPSEAEHVTPLPQVAVIEQPAPMPSTEPPSRRPFFIGTVKNNRKIPLPGIMIYLKDAQGATLRLLKTNPHGVFATFNQLPAGEYTIEIKDPKGSYFFDTMKLNIGDTNPEPFEFFSKELL